MEMSPRTSGYKAHVCGSIANVLL